MIRIILLAVLGHRGCPGTHSPSLNPRMVYIMIVYILQVMLTLEQILINMSIGQYNSTM